MKSLRGITLTQNTRAVHLLRMYKPTHNPLEARLVSPRNEFVLSEPEPTRTKQEVDARNLRHLSRAEEIRLRAAAKHEDLRASVELLSDAIAAPEVAKNAHLPAVLRETLNRAAKGRARQVVQATSHTPTPRLEALLVLVFDARMLAHHALSLARTGINKDKLRASFRNTQGIGPEYALTREQLRLLDRIPCHDPSMPILRWRPEPFAAAWNRKCEDADLSGVRLMDATFEAQFRSLLTR